MERTKVNMVQNTEEEKVRWKKLGGGSFRMGNKIIKPGETFWAFPSEIPKPFRDVVVALDATVVFEKEKAKEKKLEEQIKGNKSAFTIKKREGSQWFDVFDSQEKKINEKGLSEEKANKFKEDLEKK